MAKHTSGEWKYVRGAKLGYIVANSKPVADVSGPDRTTQDTNGRLIAAAPKMLELLQDLMVIWDEDRLDELRLRTRALLKEVKDE
jgi:hypothetical protein